PPGEFDRIGRKEIDLCLASLGKPGEGEQILLAHRDRFQHLHADTRAVRYFHRKINDFSDHGSSFRNGAALPIAPPEETGKRNSLGLSATGWCGPVSLHEAPVDAVLPAPHPG